MSKLTLANFASPEVDLEVSGKIINLEPVQARRNYTDEATGEVITKREPKIVATVLPKGAKAAIKVWCSPLVASGITIGMDASFQFEAFEKADGSFMPSIIGIIV